MRGKLAKYLPNNEIINTLGRTLLLSGSMFVLSVLLGKIGVVVTSLLFMLNNTELLFNIYQSSILAALLIWWLRNIEAQSDEKMGFRRIDLKTVGISIACGVIIFGCLLFGADFCGRLWSEQIQAQPLIVQAENAVSLSEIAGIYFLSVVVAPISEEIMFRGFIYQHSRECLGRIGSMLFASLLFGVLHFDLYRFALLFLAAVGLNILREISGSLYASMIAHSVWNICMLSMVFLF